MEKYTPVYFDLNNFIIHFEENFQEFKKVYTDATFKDFVFEYKRQVYIWQSNVTYLFEPSLGSVIKAELLGENIVNQIQEYIRTGKEIDEIKRKNLIYTFASISEYLEEITQVKDIKPFDYPIKWKGTNVELAELIKALIESHKLDPGLTQKEIFNRFALFFDYDIKETTGIKDFTKRKDKQGNLTKFLDSLKVNLHNWFENKEEKKDYR